LELLPRRVRRLYTMRRFELGFPLRHPRHVIEHVAYKESLYRAQAWNHPRIKIARSLEELWLNMRHGEWRNIWRSLRNRVLLWAGKKRFA